MTRVIAAFSPSCASRDDELHPGEAAAGQIAQKGGPEGLGFRRADVQTDDLAPALCGNADGNYPATLTILPPSRTFR